MKSDGIDRLMEKLVKLLLGGLESQQMSFKWTRRNKFGW